MKEGWEIKKLGEVCEIICGQDYKLVKDDKGPYPIYGTGGIMGYASQYKCPANSVIIGRKGSINNPLFVTEKFWNVDTAFGVVPNVAFVVPKFFYFFCKNYDFTKHDVSVTIPSLRRTDIIRIPIPVPPLPTQERIVSELDCINSILEKKREQLKELDTLAQSIFYDMFGDPIRNEKGWEVRKLGEVAEISSGGTPSRKKQEYFTGNINWYSAGELNSLYLPDSVEQITEDAIKESAAKIFKCNTLMVGMYDTAAFKMGILKKDSASNQACANVNLHTDNVVWMYYLLTFMKDEALKHRHGARQKNLNVGFIKSFQIPLPPLPLQQEFATKIEAIEKQKELIKRSIAEVETLLASRMQYYFG